MIVTRRKFFKFLAGVAIVGYAGGVLVKKRFLNRESIALTSQGEMPLYQWAALESNHPGRNGLLYGIAREEETEETIS